MPSRNKYDTTINCSPDNPLTLISRGKVHIGVRYEKEMDPQSDLFIEVRVGRRRQRTAFSKYHDHAEILKDVLLLLGFEPEITIQKVDYDEDYGDYHELWDEDDDGGDAENDLPVDDDVPPRA